MPCSPPFSTAPLMENDDARRYTHHGGSERIESAEDKAQRIVRGRKWPDAAGAWLNWSNDGKRIRRKSKSPGDFGLRRRRLAAGWPSAWQWEHRLTSDQKIPSDFRLGGC